MGLFGLFGRGKPSATAGLDPGPAFSWQAEQGADSPYGPGVGDPPPPAPRAPRPSRRPKLNDDDRHVFQAARNMTAHNTWYYRDRLNVPRGPATLPVLREAWIHGVIDEHTLIWGHGLMDWLPARNVRTLVPQIRTVEVAVATWVKKQLVLKPALAAARRARAEHRPEAAGEQVKRMY